MSDPQLAPDNPPCRRDRDYDNLPDEQEQIDAAERSYERYIGGDS